MEERFHEKYELKRSTLEIHMDGNKATIRVYGNHQQPFTDTKKEIVLKSGPGHQNHLINMLVLDTKEYDSGGSERTVEEEDDDSSLLYVDRLFGEYDSNSEAKAKIMLYKQMYDIGN